MGRVVRAGGLNAEEIEAFVQAGETEGALDVGIGVGELQFAAAALGGLEGGDNEVQADGIHHAGLSQIEFNVAPGAVFIAGRLHELGDGLGGDGVGAGEVAREAEGQYFCFGIYVRQHGGVD